MKTPLLLLCGLSAALLTAPAGADTWTDDKGKYTLEAEFVAIRGNNVLLKRQDGTTIAVPLNRLNEASQQLAKKLAGPAQPLAPLDADDPIAYVVGLSQQMQAGNLSALWEAMPPSYQKDVNEVVQTFAKNMDSSLWDSGVGLLKKAAQVLSTKKTFIVGAIKAQGLPIPIEDAAMAKNLETAAQVIALLADSDLLNLEKLKAMDVGLFAKGNGAQLFTKFAAMAQAAAADNGFPGVKVEDVIDPSKATIISREGDQVTIRVEAPEFAGPDATPEEVVIVKVEGKWLPQEMAIKWQATMLAAKSFVGEQMGPGIQQAKPIAIGVTTMAGSLLDQLLQAGTQEEFDAVIDQAKQALGGLGGPAGPGPAGPGGAEADPFGS